MKKLIIVLVGLFLIGCHSKSTSVAYRCPKLILPKDPIPQTKTLTDKSTPADIIKAWVATATEYRGWNKTVRRQVESSN